MKFFIVWRQARSPFGRRGRRGGGRIPPKFIGGWFFRRVGMGYRFYNREIAMWRWLCQLNGVRGGITRPEMGYALCPFEKTD